MWSKIFLFHFFSLKIRIRFNIQVKYHSSYFFTKFTHELIIFLSRQRFLKAQFHIPIYSTVTNKFLHTSYKTRQDIHQFRILAIFKKYMTNIDIWPWNLWLPWNIFCNRLLTTRWSKNIFITQQHSCNLYKLRHVNEAPSARLLNTWYRRLRRLIRPLLKLG